MPNIVIHNLNGFMKKNTLLNNKKLAGYSAMAAGFMACGTAADAQIVYVDITDVTLDLGFYIPLDLDLGGADDFILQVSSNTAGNWTFVNGFGNLSTLSAGGPNNAMVGYDGSIFPYASALESGSAIDAADDFITNSLNYAFFASI